MYLLADSVLNGYTKFVLTSLKLRSNLLLEYLLWLLTVLKRINEIYISAGNDSIAFQAHTSGRAPWHLVTLVLT